MLASEREQEFVLDSKRLFATTIDGVVRLLSAHDDLNRISEHQQQFPIFGPLHTSWRCNLFRERNKFRAELLRKLVCQVAGIGLAGMPSGIERIDLHRLLSSAELGWK